MRLFDYAKSGNCYKARMMLARLDIPYERVPTDPSKGDTQKLEFLALSAKGRTPVLVLDDGTALPESNAILSWLAYDTPWWCDERMDRTRMLEWMFFEQNNHETTIATRRHWLHEDERPARVEAVMDYWLEEGTRMLGVMERHLRAHPWFVGERESIADLALYAYTHVAEEGGFDLSELTAVRDWIDRVADHPRHVTIDA